MATPDKDEALLDEAYEHALALMRENAHEDGYVAATERNANYYAVWTRDHCISAIAAYMTDEDDLKATARAGIVRLMKSQLDNGHVPSYIEMESGHVEYGGYGRIVSIDSSMWIAITTAFIYDITKDKKLLCTRRLRRYKQMYRLLRSSDMDKCGLIEVPTSGDWADVFDRSYHVLYAQVLYFEALRSLLFLFSEALLHTKMKYEEARKIRRRIVFIKQRMQLVRMRLNKSLWLSEENVQDVMDEYMVYNDVEVKDYPYYQSHMRPFAHGWAHRVDTFGNALAASSRLAPKERARQFIDFVLEQKINTPLPLPALYPAIQPDDLDWITIYEEKEKPHTYHNGGIWPMVTGFWIHALVRHGYAEVAQKDLVAIAKYFKKVDWHFPEHIHGETLEPLGNRKQTWSAAGYIIAYQALKKGKSVFRAYRPTR